MKLRIDSSMVAGCSLCNFPPSNNWFGSLQDECFSFFYTERIRMVLYFCSSIILEHYFINCCWSGISRNFLEWHCIQKDILQHLFYRITSTSSLQGSDSWRSFYCKEKITIVENEHFLYPIGLIKVWYVYHCLPTFIVDFMVNVCMEIHHACILWVYTVFLHLFP